jgi:hypothetical protein
MGTSDEARAFFETLFAPYTTLPEARRLRLEMRPLCPKWHVAATPSLTPSERDGGPPRTGPRAWFPLTPACFQQAAQRAVGLGSAWDVYMGVLPRLGNRGGRYDVPFACWLWCDVDGGEEGIEGAKARVEAADIPLPSVAVVSGSGLHCYWRLTEPAALSDKADCDRFQAVLKRLVKAIGGTAPAAHADGSRADTASILRVPATWNWKRREEPRPVYLLPLASPGEPCSLAWWRANLPVEPAPPAYRERQRLPGEVLPLPRGTLTKIATPCPAGQRNPTRVQIAVSAAKSGFDADAIALLLDTHSATSGVQNHRENLSIARWAYRHTR